MHKVKDSINLMYKRVEALCDHDDQDYNYLARTFAYKCQFIRDPQRVKYLFEIFVPINKYKGNKKLKEKENKLKKTNHNYKGFKPHQLKQNDFMKAIMVEEILTDDSIKDIDYRDINSDFSEEGFN